MSSAKTKKITATNSRVRSIRHWGILFLGPVTAAFTIGFIWPFIQGIYLSFCQFRLTSDAKFIGLGNYAAALADQSFRYSFWYTAGFAVVSLVLINVLAFAVAYALTQNLKGSNIFRTVFFAPNLIGGIVLGYIWSMIFDGILSRYGTSVILETKYGFWGLIILMCWQQVGYMMIIYIAGLQNVPPELIEAAELDGAGRWELLRHVTIPMVMPSITICLFLTLSNTFKLFDQNLALTNGAPSSETEMVALNIVNTMFNRIGVEGVGQAKAVIFVVVVVVFAMFQLRATRSREVEA